MPGVEAMRILRQLASPRGDDPALEAWIYVQLGDTSRALEALESSTVLSNPVLIVMPNLMALRSSPRYGPRYMALVRRIGVRN